MMFTLLTLGVPLGVIVGYIVTSIVVAFFNVRSLNAIEIGAIVESDFLHSGLHAYTSGDMLHGDSF